MQKPAMIIGQKGQKYGLITRKDDTSKKTAAKQAATGRLAAFGGDSDSDEDGIEAQVARQAARKVADHKVQDMYATALADDPNAFEYDSLYESMQEQKAAPKQQERLARRPKYIASLLEQAEVRKREQGITFERVLLKERQKEDHMYDSTEKFITSAYRRKLEEDKQWQESQRLKELEEQQNDVTKQRSMSGFYTNLAKNVAMGGNTTTTAAARSSSSPPGQQQQQQQHPGSPPGQGPDDPAAAAAAAAGRGSSESEHDEDAAAKQQRQRQAEDAADAAPQQEHGSGHQQQQHSPQRQRHDSPDPQARGTAAAAAATVQSGVPADQPPEQAQQQAQAAAAVAAGKRKNTDDAVAAARERYLARKRQQQGGA